MASAGGSVLAELVRVAGADCEFRVVTDRACGAESVADGAATPRIRVDDPDRESFSSAVCDWFVDQGADVVLLYFARVVGSALHQRLPTFNVHPSLLPAFRGFGALEAAREAGVRVVGSTLHLATGDIDGGPIVAQAWDHLTGGEPIERLARLAFVQKTRVSLVLLELLLDGALDLDAAAGSVRVTCNAAPDGRSNPGVRHPAFRTHLDRLDSATP